MTTEEHNSRFLQYKNLYTWWEPIRLTHVMWISNKKKKKNKGEHQPKMHTDSKNETKSDHHLTVFSNSLPWSHSILCWLEQTSTPHPHQLCHFIDLIILVGHHEWNKQLVYWPMNKPYCTSIYSKVIKHDWFDGSMHWQNSILFSLLGLLLFSMWRNLIITRVQQTEQNQILPKHGSTEVF